MTEPLRDDVLKMGIEFMEKHDDAFKRLAAIEREELKAELEMLKRKTTQGLDKLIKKLQHQLEEHK